MVQATDATLENLLADRIAEPLRHEMRGQIQQLAQHFTRQGNELARVATDVVRHHILVERERGERISAARMRAVATVLKERHKQLSDVMVEHVRQELDAAVAAIGDTFKAKLDELANETERLKRELATVREQAGRAKGKRKLRVRHSDGTESIIREEYDSGGEHVTSAKGKRLTEAQSKKARDLAIKDGISFDVAAARVLDQG